MANLAQYLKEIAFIETINIATTKTATSKNSMEVGER